MKILTTFFLIVSYYLAWFTSVLSAAHNYRWYGFIAVICICMLQLTLLYCIKKTKSLVTMIFLISASGFLVDSVLSFTGVIIFNANPWPIAFAPPWIICLWITFSIVYYATLDILFSRYLLTSIISFFAFPLAYIAGIMLGAGELPHGYFSSVVIGAIWALLLPYINYRYVNKVLGECNDTIDS